MSQIPSELKYTDSHEWIRVDEDGLLTVGITDHAQEALGDLVFVELPEPGTEFQPGDECGVVESVKAASDFFCPLQGEVVEVNELLNESPEIINQDPYGEGWLFRMHIENDSVLEDLLTPDKYSDLIAD